MEQEKIYFWRSKTEFGAQNQIGRLIYPSIGNFTWRINIFLGVKKFKIGPRAQKRKFGAQNLYGRVIYPSIGNFTRGKKKYTFGGQKVQNRPEPKN
jgi:hypothetical protein